MYYYKIDGYPSQKDSEPYFVDEPWLIDKSIIENYAREMEKLENDEDNIRVYVPMDISGRAICRRLYNVICHYGESNEKNELDFRQDVDMVLSQLEVYDQIMCKRENVQEGKHSSNAIGIVRDIIAVAILEEIPDGCAERFPFETIDELKKEYL